MGYVRGGLKPPSFLSFLLMSSPHPSVSLTPETSSPGGSPLRSSFARASSLKGSSWNVLRDTVDGMRSQPEVGFSRVAEVRQISSFHLL
jgi:hypothetical protein